MCLFSENLCEMLENTKKLEGMRFAAGLYRIAECRILTLWDASVERNDGKIEHLRNSSTKVHTHWHKEYTWRGSIVAHDDDTNISSSSPQCIITR